jgi:hypothetical protein
MTPEISNLMTGQRLIENALGLNKPQPTKPMTDEPRNKLVDPTKRSLIDFLEQLPYADDARLNVSFNELDIDLAKIINASAHPGGSNEFLLNIET